MPVQSIELLSRYRSPELRETCADSVAERRQPKLVQIRSGSARAIALVSLGTDWLRRSVSNPEQLLAAPRVWLKNESDHRVGLVAMDFRLTATGPSNATCCCKESISRRWWVPLLARFMSLRSHNAFHQGLILRQAGISTPQPLAVVTVTRRGAYHEYLLTEAIPGATSLQQWVRGLSSRETSAGLWRDRRTVARELGSQLQHLHQYRFDHRDLKPSNILLSEITRVWLIDLDGVWRWPVLPRARRVQNLARLWAGLADQPGVTSTDALRFLLAYLSPKQYGEWKSLWRQVVRRARKKISQKRFREAAAATSNLLPAQGGTTRI